MIEDQGVEGQHSFEQAVYVMGATRILYLLPELA